jgi:outer membrane protein
MKTLLKLLVPGFLLVSSLGGPAFAQSRVATVDIQKVFDKYWKTEQAIAALKDRVTQIQKSRQEMIDGLNRTKDEYQKLLEDANNQAISAEERDKRKQAAEDKLKDLKSGKDDIDQFDRQAGVTIGEQKARMRKNILDEIKLAIGSKAKAGGYSIVIDSGAQTYVADPSGPYYTPTVLYSADDNDLTDTVISQLNAGAPVATPKAEENKGESKGTKK